jgi:gamma-glutamylcyclotransferase (GGCT)/AIG2-like uncharacterized protein YtfP
MSSVLYFAYGSNLDAEQLARRCPSSRGLYRARLPDHRLDFTHFSRRWVGGVADVLLHSGEEVWGAVYELAEADLARLDRYEAGYDRVVLRVEADDGALHQAVSYTVTVKHFFPPTETYVERMLRGGERWKLPAQYLERLRSAPATRSALRRPR